MLHSPCATPDLNLWLLFLSWHILCQGNTAVGKIMKKFIVIFSKYHASFWVRQLFVDRPAGGCRRLVFPLFMLLNCPPNMCPTLNPLDQLLKKWILRIIIKTSFEYCSLNSANPYTFKYLNNGGSIQLQA